ncbi:polyketide synthetase, partial [Cladorrhinum samala]
MAGLSQLIVFGDQAVPYADELRRFIAKRADYTLATLLGEAYHALRADMARLPSSQRTQFPSHSNLSELLTAHASSTAPNCALDSALAVLHQIASFVSYLNETGRETAYPKSPSTTLIGSCIGLLSALAISSSETIGELVQITPDVVVLAFRLGLVVQNKTALVMSASSSSSSSSSASTSYAVASIDKDTASSLISTFYESRSLSPATRVYVSAIGNGNVTVSGPPAQLQDFLSQHQSLKSARIAMNGLFHSAALYDPSVVAALIETAASERLRSRVGKLDIISNSEESGEAIIPSGRSAEQTLQAILSEILLRQMRWDLVTQRAAELSKSSPQATILPFAAGSVQGLATAIGQGEATTVDIVDTARRPAAAAQVGGGRKRESGQSDRSKIAIIGYSGRFPEADSNEEFWNLFLAGLDVVKEIPKDRFDPALYYDPTGKKKNTSGVTKGCFVKNPDLFDSRFFGMSPREAEQADPAQRLALTTAYEAMEMAGFVPDSSPSTQRNRVGVFYGTASDDYREVNAAQNVDTYFVPGGSRAFLPARINYHFGFSGPSFDVDTACSSGLAAVHIACNSLWMGDCDVAIAGGTNILTNPDNWAGLDRAHFLSHTGNCKTFDDGADGYCRAESVATVLLKRLDDALLDGDPIQGVILGALTNHSAEAVSITRPHSGAQRAIFSRILDTADVDSSDVSYVEMHGTGTQHGDACEMDSVLSVFAPDERSRKSQSLYLGSAKANIGHAESASGITSLIKVLLMMEKSQIPRHVGIKTKINRNFPANLPERNVHIAMQTTPWPRPSEAEGGKRLAFVNNFGAAGGNSSVLLEDAPRSRSQLSSAASSQGHDADPRPLHVVAVSAKSQSALKKNIRALADYLKDDTPLGSLSYTTTARRVHYNFRVAVAGKNIGEIRQRLEAAETKDHFSSQSAGKGAPVGFCFTGQGAQYLGMGKRLYEVSPRFRSFITGIDEIVRLQGFDAILPIIDGTCPAPNTLETLPPATVQLATTCLQMALGKFWKALGVAPQIVVGHSLGEYAAMNMAGVLSDADTIYLVGTRAKLLEEHCTAGTHTMLAVKASASKTASLIASEADLEICCANGPEETVVGGPTSKVEAFAASLGGLAIKATLLRVQFAFHSAQVEPMLAAFQQSCSGITFKDPSTPLLSPLLSKVVTSASDLGAPSAYLSRHCRETVNFNAALLSAKSGGGSSEHTITDKMVWVEIGSHPICSNSIKASLGQATTKALPTLRRGEDDWSVIVPTLSALYESGLALDWDDYHTGFKDSLKVLRLPRYQWDLKSHWIPYTHDWLLTKGDAPLPAVPATQPPRKKVPLTTSVQDLISEVYTATESSITARSDVQDPAFAAILKGHRVNGQPVCSSAVYADMAMTLFARMLDKSPAPGFEGVDKSTDIGIEVSDMVVDKSLILGANPEEEQLLEMKASVNWATRRASFTLCSIDAVTGRPTANHCKCSGTFTPKSRWVAEWSRREYLIRSRIAHLRKAVADEDDGVCHLKTGMFYKLFSALVDYHPPFKGCRELIMKSADFESTGKVRFNAPPEGGRWDWPPTWLDSIGQITGFTMNANDTLDSRAQVWINHGWENMKLTERLSSEVTYQTYVKMQAASGEDGAKSYVGDVHIFNPATGSIVGVYEGVTFSAVPRKILDKVLPRPGGSVVAAPRQPAVAAPVAPKPVLVQEQAPVVSSIPQQQVQAPVTQPPAPAPAAPAETSSSSSSLVSATKLKTILAEEVGAPVSEVADDMELADLGVDSLLALTIADRLLEELGVKVDSAIFIAGLKVQELVQIVTGGDGGTDESSDSASSDSDAETISEPSSTPATMPSPKLSPAAPAFKCPPATSVLLQGVPYSSSSSKKKTLWLFPDGSGLAISYLPLPDVVTAADATSVYGLNSPFVKNTAGMDLCGFDDLITAYIAEIRRRQPQGPYLVGGWSAGGMCAYRAAQRIAAESGADQIAGLVLIDSPAPMRRKKLPERLYEEFDKRNIFGSIGGTNPKKPARAPPAWLLGHFTGFSRMLDTITLRPWAETVGNGRGLVTWAVWAADGVDEEGSIEIRPEDPAAMAWLLRKRRDEDLVSNGWDVLVGGEAIVEVEVVRGANHFTLMSKPEALESVASVLRRAI